MEEFWILIFVSFFTTNSLDKAESVKLELKTFDEIFGEGWWDKNEAEDLKTPAPTKFGQNVHHQIDRQNTRLGQIEPNSTDQIAEDEQKRKIIDKFHAMKDEYKQKEKHSTKEWYQIEKKIAKHLKVNRKKIYEWKKELGLSRKTGINYSNDEKLKIVKELMRMKSGHSGEDKKSCKEIDKEIAERFGVNVRKINRWKKEFGLCRTNPKNERGNLIEKFDQMKAELMRAGFKNSYRHEIDETIAKELGLSDRTIYRWKRELGQTALNYKYGQSEQKELIKRYYKIKEKNSKISDEDIANILKIGIATLYKWKRQFNRQQFHSNSVNGHFV